MTNIEKIERKLKELKISYYIDGESIKALPNDEDGFTVMFVEHDSGYTVSYDSWHDDYKDEEDALAVFAFGLSEDCRLKVILRGPTECAWMVQELEDGEWTDGSTTSHIFTPFWKKRSIQYRQNHFIKLTPRTH